MSTKFANKITSVTFDATTGDVSSPADGQMWYNNTTKRFRKRENGQIYDVPTVSVGTSAPASPQTGDLWVDTN